MLSKIKIISRLIAQGFLVCLLFSFQFKDVRKNLIGKWTLCHYSRFDIENMKNFDITDRDSLYYINFLSNGDLKKVGPYNECNGRWDLNNFQNKIVIMAVIPENIYDSTWVSEWMIEKISQDSLIIYLKGIDTITQEKYFKRK